MDEVRRMADAFTEAMGKLLSSEGHQADIARLRAAIDAMAGRGPEARILAYFRANYSDRHGWPEHHLANCRELHVVRFEVTGAGTFTSVLRCPHRRPMGYSVLPEEPWRGGLQE